MTERRYYIQEASDALAVSADTLRRLEKSGVLQPAKRDWNGHRYYTESDIEHIRSILFPPATPATTVPA